MNHKASGSPFIDDLENKERQRNIHAHGSFPYKVLKQLEEILPSNMNNTAETGCGRSTILFSQISANHKVFCLEDREYGARSSVRYFEKSQLFNKKTVECIFGPTQETLQNYQHTNSYDCVLIDGPHGYPFPDLEYFHFFPHIKEDGLLIIDDVHIPSIGRMADIIQEDAMWEFIRLIDSTAVFRRTNAEMLPRLGDHWWTQNFNRRRINNTMDFYLDDNKKMPSFAERLKSNDKEKHNSKKKNLIKRIRTFF